MKTAHPSTTEIPAKRGRFLMVGRRKGAIAATERCGLEPVVIDVPARGEQAQDAFGGSTQWALDKATELFREEPPVGVAAVATGSVVAAAAVREFFGLPGISRDTALRCHNKLVMKKAIAAAAIPCAPWQETSTDTTAGELVETLGLPLVLKMPISSGGRGVWICKNLPEVSAALRPGLLAEAFVDGTEMSIETLRCDGVTIFRNPTHYLKPRWANVVPATLGKIDAALVTELAEEVHDALDISSGISHMEIFMTPSGPVFGEIAARPPGGFIMDLLNRAYGFDPWEAVVRVAIGEKPAVPATAERFAGVWLLHPGDGEVSEVSGRDEALRIPDIVSVSCRLRPGDLIKPRVGSGESKGKIIAEASTNQACATALKTAADTVQILLTESFAQC